MRVLAILAEAGPGLPPRAVWDVLGVLGVLGFGDWRNRVRMNIHSSDPVVLRGSTGIFIPTGLALFK